MFVPPLLILLVVMTSFLLSPKEGEKVQLDVCNGALVSSVMFHVGLDNGYPWTDFFTLADHFMAVVYSMVLFGQVLAILKIRGKNAGDGRLARKFHESGKNLMWSIAPVSFLYLVIPPWIVSMLLFVSPLTVALLRSLLRSVVSKEAQSALHREIFGEIVNINRTGGGRAHASKAERERLGQRGNLIESHFNLLVDFQDPEDKKAVDAKDVDDTAAADPSTSDSDFEGIMVAKRQFSLNMPQRGFGRFRERMSTSLLEESDASAERATRGESLSQPGPSRAESRDLSREEDENQGRRRPAGGRGGARTVSHASPLHPSTLNSSAGNSHEGGARQQGSPGVQGPPRQLQPEGPEMQAVEMQQREISHSPPQSPPPQQHLQINLTSLGRRTAGSRLNDRESSLDQN